MESIGTVIKTLSAKWGLPVPTDQGEQTPGPMTTSGQTIPREIAERCPICKGAGWLKRYTNGRDVSEGSYLVACDCTDRERQYKVWTRARKASGLLESLFYMTFDNYHSERQPQPFEAARVFAADPSRGWLVMVGEVGTGKTHLAAAIVNELLGSQDWRPVYAFVPEMLRHLRSGFDSGEHEQRWADLQQAQVLVLDDFGAEKASDWSTETMTALIDYRYVTGKPTVVASNLTIAQMPPRIGSRLGDRARSRVVTMRQGDYRQSRERQAERNAPRNFAQEEADGVPF